MVKSFEDMYNCLHRMLACDGWMDRQTDRQTCKCKYGFI